LLFVSAALSVESERSYKIDNVRHAEKFNDIDNIEDIDESHKLSEIGLTNKQEQQIMDEKSVTTKNKLEIDSGQTIALTTDSGAYIVYVETTYPDTLRVMTLVCFMLFFCIFLVSVFIIDVDCKYIYRWGVIILVAGLGAILSNFLFMSLAGL
jgi:hypothetical protein